MNKHKYPGPKIHRLDVMKVLLRDTPYAQRPILIEGRVPLQHQALEMQNKDIPRCQGLRMFAVTYGHDFMLICYGETLWLWYTVMVDGVFNFVFFDVEKGMLQKAPTIPSCSGRWWKHPVKPNARPDGHGRHGCRRSRWNPTQRIPNVEINGCNRCSGRSGSLWAGLYIYIRLYTLYMYMIIFQRGFHRTSQDLVKMMWETPEWCKKGPQRTSVQTNPGLWNGTNQWS